MVTACALPPVTEMHPAAINGMMMITFGVFFFAVGGFRMLLPVFSITVGSMLLYLFFIIKPNKIQWADMNNALAIVFAVLLFAEIQERLQFKRFRADLIAKFEKKKADSLLQIILPEKVITDYKKRGVSEPVYYDSVSVLFTDFVSFTQIAEKMSPGELVSELDGCFSYFDNMVERYNLIKLKTIGDAYMCAGGLPEVNNTHSVDIIMAALEIHAFMMQTKKFKKELKETYWELRIGIHTGPVVAGVIGERNFSYDIWGDTVNTASRMESSGVAGMINISSDTYWFVKRFFSCEHRGKLKVKGKGKLDMYSVNGIRSGLSIERDGRRPTEKFKEMYKEIQKIKTI
ncbi:MAG TPA: hypothetical protein ENI15_11580 [Spirochaetes bacterium]|nr:hypothetical protein [Spirochaetota bacterium]